MFWLQKIFFKFVESGVKYVCIEVSAHAIYLNKIFGLMFEVVVFSNLTEDHLDYFKTMENYFNAKRKLFSKTFTKQAIINVDDEYGKKLVDCINVRCKTYSIYNKSDYKIENLGIKNYVQEFEILGEKIKSRFLGEFNVYNLGSSIACLKLLGFKNFETQKIVSMINQIPGRFNQIVIKRKLFIIDYAHTPDGLENVLILCKKIVGGKKLISVFGCGGNRETQKRAKMGEISSKYANFTIITSDNPRFENRMNIASEIEKGIIGDNYIIILDRSEAIKFADKISNEGDVILIAGKGAENYIDEQGEKKYYSDYDEIEKLGNEKWLII